MQDKTYFFSLAKIVSILQNTPAVLSTILRSLPNEVYAYHPGDGRWCAKEVVGHLIEEDQRDFLGRIKLMLDFDEPVLTINHQDEVARARRDCNRDLNELLDEFAAGRRKDGDLSFIESFGDKDLRRGGIHPKIGRIEIGNLLHEWVYHDLNHIRQIAANAQSFLLGNLGNMRKFYQ